MENEEQQEYANDLAKFYGIEKETEFSKHLALLGKIDLSKNINNVLEEATKVVLLFSNKYSIDETQAKLIKHSSFSPFTIATDSNIEVQFKVGSLPFLATEEMRLGFIKVIKESIIKNATLDLDIIQGYQALKAKNENKSK